MSWSDANDHCQRHGGSLIAINDAKEQNFVNRMTRQLFGDYAVWIGLRRGPEGKFLRWDNGETLDYTKWIRNEPNNLFGTEDCTEMFRYWGAWLVTSCNRRHPFICEIGEF